MEVLLETMFVLRFTEKEYNLLARGLAQLSGVETARVSSGDRAAAAALNTRLLDVQHANLKEKLAIVEGKRERLAAAAPLNLDTVDDTVERVGNR